MTHTWCFTVQLLRVFDSGAPEHTAAFWSGTRQLFPQVKPDGVYVFIDGETAKRVRVRCPGYLSAEFEAEPGKIIAVPLYPAYGYCPPAGWRVTFGCAPPGRLCWGDSRFELRMLGWDVENRGARIRPRPGFLGGMLLFSNHTWAFPALVIGKRPPDLFLLDALPPQPAECAAKRVWAARSEPNQKYAVVTPEDFSPVHPVWKEGDEALSESEL